MAIIAPNIKVAEPQYIANEIATAMSTTENLMLTYGDELVGIYADNNHGGDGVARAIEQAGQQDNIYVVAFDDDQEELDACKNNIIKALIIQDQFNMGYSGVEYAMKAINGTLDTDYVDTGVAVTWPADL
jgi:ribose transport system substrate-binding protein